MMAVEHWINCLDCEYNEEITFSTVPEYRILEKVQKHIDDTKHVVQVVRQFKASKS